MKTYEYNAPVKPVKVHAKQVTKTVHESLLKASQTEATNLVERAGKLGLHTDDLIRATGYAGASFKNALLGQQILSAPYMGKFTQVVEELERATKPAKKPRAPRKPKAAVAVEPVEA